MTDLFGHGAPPQPLRDIRNTRPGVAEEKAQLLLRLGRLIDTIPPGVRDGSVQRVRAWRQARADAAKVAASKRASVQELQSAINRMDRRW